MNFTEYMPLALRTAKPHPHEQQVMHALLGLVTEIGELADAIKRHAIYGKPLDKVNVMEECADCWWYLNLFMYEKHLAASLIDAAWAQAQKTYAEDKKVPTNWELVEGMLGVSALGATLYVPEKDSGVAHRELVELIALGLCSFLIIAETDLSTSLVTNINKLAERYGEKYSDYRALNRDTAAERQVLEGGTS